MFRFGHDGIQRMPASGAPQRAATGFFRSDAGHSFNTGKTESIAKVRGHGAIIDGARRIYSIYKLPVPLSTSPCRATALSAARLRGTGNL
jgi:hypothetical protein